MKKKNQGMFYLKKNKNPVKSLKERKSKKPQYNQEKQKETWQLNVMGILHEILEKDIRQNQRQSE